MNPFAIREKTYAGGDLFAIAAAELGDATQWARIAKLNGMWDHRFNDVRALRIPPKGDGNGGIRDF